MKTEEIIACDKKYFMPVFNGRYPVVIDSGSGIRVYGKDGSEYLDFLAGIGVNALGYNHPVLTAALEEQIKKVIHTSNLYYIEPQAELEELLINHSCTDRVFFTNSGAEANEGAIKLARKHFKKKGLNQYEIITANRSFHGRTLATLAATGQSKYQKPFQPLPIGFKTVPFNDLEAIKKAVSNKTAAIMLEPIQGEGGVYPADEKYLTGLREFCDNSGLILIFDEIQCGLGRTGTLFTYEHYGVEPDILTLAKALGGGVPIGAFLAKEEIALSFEPGDHGSTFGGNHLATKAAVTTLKVILEKGFLEQVKEVSEYFRKSLSKLVEELVVVKGYRGKGLMLALELAETVSAVEVTNKMFKKGFLINPVQEHTLRFLPPLIVKPEEINLLTGALKDVLQNYKE